MKINLRKRINPSVLYYGIGSLLMVGGILLFIFQQNLIWRMNDVIGIILIVSSLSGFSDIYLKISDRTLKENLMSAIVPISQFILGIILLFCNYFSIALLHIIVGIYLLATGLIHLLNYYLLIRDQVRGELSLLIKGLFQVILGLTTVTISNSKDQLYVILSVYLMLLGFSYFQDALEFSEHTDTANRKNSNRFRLPLPVFLTALLPYNFINKVNQVFWEADDKDILKLNHDDEQIDSNSIEILIHTGRTGFDKIGHIDFVYKDHVISYGNHDVETHILGGAIGDGVLTICPRDPYLDFSQSRGTSIFSYQVLINSEMMVEMTDHMDELRQKIYPFEIETDKQKQSYLGKLLQATNGNAYKFNSGRYKTYFVLGTNCIEITDEIIGSKGLNLLQSAGIISPGTVFDYLEKQLKLPHSLVTKRQIFVGEAKINS